MYLCVCVCVYHRPDIDQHGKVIGKKVGHCIIEHKPSGFGFAEPYFIHETLTDLVLHYSEVSLAEHNDDLDLKLSYPINADIGSEYVQVGQQHMSNHVAHSNSTESQNYVEYSSMGGL